MSEYRAEDFTLYSACFSRVSAEVVELMRILDTNLQVELDMHSVRPKDLFRMAMDLSYETDRLYKKEKGIEDEPFNITTYISKDELASQMRTLLRDELQRYFNAVDSNDE